MRRKYGPITTAILTTLSRFTPRQWSGSRLFYSLTGSGLGGFWGEKNYDKYISYFNDVPEVNAVINYRAKAESRIQLDVVSKKTGEPVSNNSPFVKILRNPNWFQSQTEWWRMGSISRSVFGNEMHYMLTPTGMGRNYKGLFILPPQNMYIYCPEIYYFLEPSMPDTIKYWFQYKDNERQLLDNNSIIHLSDNRITFEVDKDKNDSLSRRNYMWGTSKLASLSPAIENCKISYEARNTLRKLPVGVLSNAASDKGSYVPFAPDEKKKLQENLQKYGLELGRNQIILSSQALNFNQTIVDIDKLKVYEEVKHDQEKICDAYGVPFELFGNQKGTTFENKKYAEREMYQDTIIPATNEKIEALNKIFKTDKESWEIQGSYEHLPIFQENIKERAQSLNMITSALNRALQDGAITIDEYKKELSKFGI